MTLETEADSERLLVEIGSLSVETLPMVNVLDAFKADGLVDLF